MSAAPCLRFVEPGSERDRCATCGYGRAIHADATTPTGERLPTPVEHVAAMDPSAGRWAVTAARAVEERDAAILARLDALSDEGEARQPFDTMAKRVDELVRMCVALAALRPELRGQAAPAAGDPWPEPVAAADPVATAAWAPRAAVSGRVPQEVRAAVAALREEARRQMLGADLVGDPLARPMAAAAYHAHGKALAIIDALDAAADKARAAAVEGVAGGQGH